ncbi:MAG: antibiotic biosynthesis monooxygenase [Flavobacteriales bacterium]|nr:antibiotic biosynthesis monooxygenase [Flavobacteriales bacterium]
MLTRLVKMTFRSEACAEFERIFETASPQIRAFEGCRSVELLRDMEAGNIYFTRSTWKSDAALQAYRNSELFAATWAKTKVLFEEKAEAWSMESVASL